MDPEHRDANAAIRLSIAARNTGPAGNVGIDDDHLPSSQGARPRRLEHLPREFVAHHSGVVQIGMRALVNVIVGTANSNAANLYQPLFRSSLGLRTLLDR